MEKPKTFITWRLNDLAKALYPEVEKMFYWIDKESHEEYVHVDYEETKIIGYDDNFRYEVKRGGFDICVTADSNISLVNDVLKSLGRRFG